MVRDGHITMGQPVDICVPTGNFGNILGAYYSKVKQAQRVILWRIFHVYRVLFSKKNLLLYIVFDQVYYSIYLN